MKTDEISAVTKQIALTCGKIESLACETEDTDFAPTFGEMLLDEVRHMQMLALALTSIIAGEDREDGEGVFAAGELNSNIGEKEKKER